MTKRVCSAPSPNPGDLRPCHPDPAHADTPPSWRAMTPQGITWARTRLRLQARRGTSFPERGPLRRDTCGPRYAAYGVRYDSSCDQRDNSLAQRAQTGNLQYFTICNIFLIVLCSKMSNAEIQMRKRTFEQSPNLLGFIVKQFPPLVKKKKKKKSPMINWSQSLTDLEFTILIISNKVDIHSLEGNIYTLNKERAYHIPFKMFPPC